MGDVSALSIDEENEVKVLEKQLERRKPIGYFVAPDGTERPLFPEGGEWDSPFPLSARHRFLSARDVYLARKCAKEMIRRHMRAISFCHLSEYEVCAVLMDRVLRIGKSLQSDSQKVAILENEFWKMLRRRYYWISKRKWEVSFSNLSKKDFLSMPWAIE